MKKSLILGLILVIAQFIAIPLALAASPSIVGSWNVTFLLEPNRSTGATQCIVFTLVPGRVAGVATSGTWRSPTFPGWSGEWIQLGDHVRWFGVTSALATEESGDMQNVSRIGGVSFNHFSKTTAATSSAGNWFGLRVNQCPGIINLNKDGDPSSGLSNLIQ